MYRFLENKTDIQGCYAEIPVMIALDFVSLCGVLIASDVSTVVYMNNHNPKILRP